jgi:hypothetical protein
LFWSISNRIPLDAEFGRGRVRWWSFIRRLGRLWGWMLGRASRRWRGRRVGRGGGLGRVVGFCERDGGRDVAFKE